MDGQNKIVVLGPASDLLVFWGILDENLIEDCEKRDMGSELNDVRGWSCSRAFPRAHRVAYSTIKKPSVSRLTEPPDATYNEGTELVTLELVLHDARARVGLCLRVVEAKGNRNVFLLRDDRNLVDSLVYVDHDLVPRLPFVGEEFGDIVAKGAVLDGDHLVVISSSDLYQKICEKAIL